MADRAQVIDAALDKSVPLQYPETIHESMRCGMWGLEGLVLIPFL
jgi:hypothetical protein